MEIIITEEAREMLNDPKNNYIVYGHRCTETDKWYIGQTCQDVNKRWGINGIMYLRKKKSGEYEHPKMGPAVKKYGWEKFEHYILEYTDIENVNTIENKWMLKKNSINNGYNCTETKFTHIKISSSEWLKGHKVSDETKQKLSHSMKTSEKAKKQRERCLINSDYLFKKGKENPMYGRHDLNFIENLGEVRYGTENAFYGKTHSEETKELIRKYHSLNKNSKESYKKMGESLSKRNEEKRKEKELFPERFYKGSRIVTKLDLDGNIIDCFKSVTDAAKNINLSHSVISACCLGKQITAGGYKWRYGSINELMIFGGLNDI